MPSIAIRILDLRKDYGRVEALRGVSVDVREGEIFGILGPNGAGKSTLIRILTGSTKPSGGSAEVVGLEPRRARGQIGYMPQAPALYEDLTPRDNLRVFGRAHGVEGLEARIDELLTLSKLRERENDPVHTFSGGMKQRVSLACALVHRPRVLLLDEPTAGVDPRLRAEFWRYFRELAAGGTTIVISTHQMNEAMLCDRLMVLSEGKAIACDTPASLLNRGRTRVRIVQEEVAEVETAEDYAEFLPQELAKHGLDPAVRRIEVERESLEEIILRWIS